MRRQVLSVLAVLMVSATAASAQFHYEVVHGFSAGGAGGRTPSGTLLETTDGSLHGTTVLGGSGDVGVVFRVLPGRSIVTRDLADATTGKNPYAGLVQTDDGTLYGTTRVGGANGSGTFFTIAPSGTFVTYDLPMANTPGFGLRPTDGPTTGPVLAADGNLYAAVQGPTFVSNSYHAGAIVRLTPQGVLTKFPAAFQDRLNAPNGQLVAAPDGYLYGTARGFAGGCSAFRFRPASAEWEVIHTFTPDEAPFPTALVLAPDGNFYGAATAGSSSPGTVFRMTPSGSVTVLHQFLDVAEGTSFMAPLIVAGDGNLYGVASQGGGFGAGTIFRVGLDGAFDVVYTFTGGADGGHPVASLIQGSDGSLYGTASTDGPAGGGVVYRLKSTVSRPALTIDSPVPDATVGTSFAISGWTLDAGAFAGTGIDAVHVYAYPSPGSGVAPIFLGVAALHISRPDVGALFGARFTPSGFSMISPQLAPGAYLIAAFGRSTVSDGFTVVATRAVTVAGPRSQPLMSLDVPAMDAILSGQFLVAGWAIDRGAPAGTGVETVHVWAIPADGSAARFVGVAATGVNRTDVGAIFGTQFTPSGYAITTSLPPGRYTIAAFAWSTVAGAFNNVGVANVTVQ